MQKRRFLALSCLAAVAAIRFAAACSSDSDETTTVVAIETRDAGHDADATAAVVVKEVPDGSYTTSVITLGGHAVGDDDDDTGGDGGSCLDQTPIDATAFRYVKAAPVMNGMCTEAELSALVSYYEANAQNQSFSILAWEAVVSRPCASCIFVDDGLRNATVWRPIVEVASEIDVIDVGGCVEHLSGSEACGQAFQQYEDCQNQACVNSCTTTGDYIACLSDPLLFTTACKGATDAVNAACGAANIPTYESTCNAGLQFEGPIRVGCIGTGPADAGADASDAGADGGE